MDCTQTFRSLEQLFVCFGGQEKGKTVFKLKLAHWIVDAIVLAYQSQGEQCPLGVRAYFIWCCLLLGNDSWRLSGRAAGWATRHLIPSSSRYSLFVFPCVYSSTSFPVCKPVSFPSADSTLPPSLHWLWFHPCLSRTYHRYLSYVSLPVHLYTVSSTCYLPPYGPDVVSIVSLSIWTHHCYPTSCGRVKQIGTAAIDLPLGKF